MPPQLGGNIHILTYFESKSQMGIEDLIKLHRKLEPQLKYLVALG